MEQLVWKQTPKVITQVPLSVAINEVARYDNWTPEKVKSNLLDEKKLLHVSGAYYHIWRDSLH